jgi:ornithine carbamoyltransferase
MSRARCERFLEVDDLGFTDLLAILDRAELADFPKVLAGRGVALLFEKPSSRTRNATEMAVVQLGGHPVTMRGEEVGIATGREIPADIARTLACYHAAICARVFDHSVLEEMAGALAGDDVSCPVVNLLSDRAHPCQALGDLLTLRQVKGALAGLRVAYVGDANNVCRSLATAGAMVGMEVTVASPQGFGLTDSDLEHLGELASKAGQGGSVAVATSPAEAVEGADAIYTDVWTSMGQESEQEARRAAFAGFRVDAALMERAKRGAVFMHCLPAHRGEEVAPEVIDSQMSVVWRQAANRMHAMRGLLLWLFS